jgi:protein-S-isoprenylcysteine O-methyltransferase Ste14
LGVARLTTRTRADWVGLATYLSIAAWASTRLATLGLLACAPVVYDVGVAATFMLRGRPRRWIRRTVPQLVAYISTFLVGAFLAASQLRHPPVLASSQTNPVVVIVGAVLVVAALLVGFWPLWYLRDSFSIEPAARRLVTTGPYGIARHPMYATYAIGFIGLLLLQPGIPLAAVIAVWCIVTYVRSRYEERVLTEAFPEYNAYRQRVGAFGPRIWHRVGGVRARKTIPRNSSRTSARP